MSNLPSPENNKNEILDFFDSRCICLVRLTVSFSLTILIDFALIELGIQTFSVLSSVKILSYRTFIVTNGI